VPTEEDLEWINEDLRGLAYPIEKLELLPGNSNKGNVPSVVASLAEFGQMEPIVCSLRPGTDIGVVLAGNTRLKAARQMGKKWIAVSWKKGNVEDHDLAFAIADNNTARKAEVDLELELEALMKIQDNDDLLHAAGYDLVGIDDLMAQIAMDDDLVEISDADETIAAMEQDLASGESEPPERKELKPVIQYTIIFDNEEQQQTWHAFMKWAKQRYPVSEGYDTHAQRLVEIIDGLL